MKEKHKIEFEQKLNHAFGQVSLFPGRGDFSLIWGPLAFCTNFYNKRLSGSVYALWLREISSGLKGGVGGLDPRRLE